MRIKRLYTFLIESYIGTFLAAFLVCLFFVLMLFLWQRIDDLIGKGLEFSVLFKFFFYAVLSSVPMAMPMTILVSSLITFGNLGIFFLFWASNSPSFSNLAFNSKNC